MTITINLLAVAVAVWIGHVQAQFQTCSKQYGSYLLVTQTGISYQTAAAVCSAFGAVPASINSVNWASMLNFYTWCSVGGGTTTTLQLPWVGGGQTAGSCPIITSVPGNTDVTTSSVACDGGQTRALLCQSVPVQTNTISTVLTNTSTFVFGTSVTVSATTTRVITVTFTDDTLTVTSTLVVPVSGTTTKHVNTATTSATTTTVEFDQDTVTSVLSESTSSGITTQTFISLAPTTLTDTVSTRTTITSPSLTQFTCVTSV